MCACALHTLQVKDEQTGSARTMAWTAWAWRAPAPDADLPPACDMGMEACSLARLSLILFRHVLSARQNLGTARPSGSLHYKVKRETGLRAGAGEVGIAGTGAQ